MIDANEKRYQVFVSSTFTDLQEERQKVLQALLEMKAFPTGMELFPSADDEQWEFIKREILSSDYYIVIIAGRYGSLAPDGLSFTEKEYDFAVASGKPVMAFLFHDLGEVKGARLETSTDGKAKLQAFREKATKGKLVKFYKNPDDLKALVWHALTHAFSLQPQEGWVRGKNLRKIEDLERIDRLQTRVSQLEAELANLRQDPITSLSKGDERANWTISWNGGRDGKRVCVGTTDLVTTWDAIFQFLFGDGTSLLGWGPLQVKMLGFCRALAPLEEARPDDQPDLGNFIREVGIQFAGLKYIGVSITQMGVTWALTTTGASHIALLVGWKRGGLSATEAV